MTTMMQRCKWRKCCTAIYLYSCLPCLVCLHQLSLPSLDSLAMSMQGESEEKTDGLDPAFVNQLLGSLPGVNPDDPAILEALRKAKDESEKKGDDKEDKEE